MTVSAILQLFIFASVLGAIAIWFYAIPLLRDHDSPFFFYCPPPSPARFFTVASLLFLQILAGFVTRQFFDLGNSADTNELDPNLVYFNLIYNLLFYVSAFPILLGSTRLIQERPVRLSEFGVTLRKLGRQIFEGVGGFLLCLIPTVVALFATSFFRDPDKQNPLLKFLEADPSPELIAAIVAMACILAPLVEELLFRVVLQGWLQEKMRPTIAIWIVAILFCAVHGLNDMLALMPLALTLGYLFYYRYSYWTVVTTHALFNLFMICGAFISSSETG